MVNMKIISVEVDEEFAKALKEIELRKMNKVLQEKGVEMHYSEKSLKEDLELPREFMQNF